MSETRNKIITISGEPASGKSTVVEALKKQYEEMGFEVEIRSVGGIFRKVVVEQYEKRYPNKKGTSLPDILADREFIDIIRSEIDTMVDDETRRYGQSISQELTPGKVYIIDSRLAWNLIPDSFAVRITVDEEIAGKRVYEDKKRGSEDSYDSVKEATEQTRKRKLGEIERYIERYGIDLTDPKNYNLILDSSYSTPEELARIIIEKEREYREGINIGETRGGRDDDDGR